jgi:uncharacterized protein (DUF2267 family)
MSTNGLDVFDKTLQTTHIWLDEIEGDAGPDRRVAWKVLGAVLHALRDRLSVELAAHLGSQLPLLVRGLYYDQYQPARQPVSDGSFGHFVAEVAGALAEVRPIDPRMAMAAVFGLLSRHISTGQIAKVQDALTAPLREFWEETELSTLVH